MTQGDLYIYTTSDFTKKHAIVSRPASDAIFCNIDYSCPQSISDSFLRIVYIQFSENIFAMRHDGIYTQEAFGCNLFGTVS